MSRPEWYYALDGEQKGPVSAEDFERLVDAGVVTPATRVWSEGMANWQTLAEVRPLTPAPAPPTPPPPIAEESSRCAFCGIGVTADDSVRLDGRVVCAACKPRAVQMLRESVPAVSGNAEDIRRTHLRHEASVRAVGSFYFLSGVAMLIALRARGEGGARLISALGLSATLVYVALAALIIWLGRGLQRLSPLARIVAVVLSGIGLIVVPGGGTLIGGYVLWLLLSAKGKSVFSAHYRQIVAETPHIKHRTLWWASVLVALLVGGMIATVAVQLVFSLAR